MLDLGYVRDHLDVIEKMARDRGITLDMKPFSEIDTERRQLIKTNEALKAERNKANEEIATLKRNKQDATAILARMKEVAEEVKRSDVRIGELDEKLQQFLLTVPNISTDVSVALLNNIYYSTARV